jgi:hypothetical protein
MNTILLLSDEARHVRQFLQDAAPTKVTVHDAKARAGCNCDRWGHPSPRCVERTVRPTADLPMSRPVTQAR